MMFFWIIVWIASAIAAGVVGKSKGRTGAGWLLGIFLGFIGLIIIALLPKKENPEEKATDIN